MKLGAFVCSGWDSGPVLVAGSFVERWHGLRPRSRGRGLLIRGGSVHGIGMREPLLIVGLDGRHSVLAVRTLQPQRFVRVRGARQILELPIGLPAPPPGSVLTWVGDGSSDPLRHTDRQSQ